MRKLLAIIVGIISLMIVALVATYSALHTKYAPQVINTLLQYGSSNDIHAREVIYDYDDPSHLQLNDVVVQPEDYGKIHIEQLDVWLSDKLWKDNRLQIANLVIDGIKLPNGLPTLSKPTYLDFVQLNQFSVNHLNLAQNGLVISEANLHIKQPQVRPEPTENSPTKPEKAKHQKADSPLHYLENLLPFYGEMKLSADQLYWKSEAFDKFYLDGDITPQETTFYALSFEWRKGKVSAQATKKSSETVWQIPQANIKDLRLQQSGLSESDKLNAGKSENPHAINWGALNLESMEWVNQIPMKIADLRIENSSFETKNYSANNIKLNAENIQFPFEFWQQQNASIFVVADGMGAFGEAISSPALDITLNGNEATVKDISLEMLQGNLHLQGKMTPKGWDLEQLNINNIKWFPTDNSKKLVWNYLSQLENIHAKMLSISNVQVIDLTEPPTQASGLSIEGDDVELKRNQQWGLWDGKVSITSGAASYDGVTSKNLLVNMHSKDGKFSLDRLFIPMQNGLVEGKGDIEFVKTSQPWNVDLEATGIPLRFFSRWFDLPLHLDGITDFTLKGEGLYGDELIFNHSVTGDLKASVTRATTTDDFETLWLRNQGLDDASLADQKQEDLQEKAKEEQAEQEQPTKDKAEEKSTQDEDSASVSVSKADEAKNDNAKETANKEPERKPKPVTITDVHLTADRGRLSLKPFTIEAQDFKAKLGGKYDFLYPDKGDLKYRLEGKCQALTFNLLGNHKDSILVENDCP
ncbi:MAG: AsmA family protein [Vibrio sp.]